MNESWANDRSICKKKKIFLKKNHRVEKNSSSTNKRRLDNQEKLSRSLWKREEEEEEKEKIVIPSRCIRYTVYFVEFLVGRRKKPLSEAVREAYFLSLAERLTQKTLQPPLPLINAAAVLYEDPTFVDENPLLLK